MSLTPLLSDLRKTIGLRDGAVLEDKQGICGGSLLNESSSLFCPQHKYSGGQCIGFHGCFGQDRSAGELGWREAGRWIENVVAAEIGSEAGGIIRRCGQGPLLKTCDRHVGVGETGMLNADRPWRCRGVTAQGSKFADID